jgi:DNA-binding MarR family transcriptional regulator
VATRLGFDPIEEAQRQWQLRWSGDETMVAATSIMRAQQIVLAAVDEALSPFDLTFARYEALVLLLFSRKHCLPLGKMGSRLMVHPTSVTNVIDRLEQQGFVDRIPHPTDRRATLAQLTESGEKVVTEATQAVTKVAFGLGCLSESDLRQLSHIVRKVRVGAGDFDAQGAPGDPVAGRE